MDRFRDQRIGAGTEMQDIAKPFPELSQPFGIEVLEQIDHRDIRQLADFTRDLVPLPDECVSAALPFDRIRQASEKGEGIGAGDKELGEVAVDDARIKRRRHRQQHRVGDRPQKPGESLPQLAVARSGRRLAAEKLTKATGPLARLLLLCDLFEQKHRMRVPAEHQQVQGDLVLTVECFRTTQNVGVTVAFDAAVEELVARREFVDQAGPAALHSEHHRIPPNDGQLAARIERGPFEAEIVDLVDDPPVRIDKDEVRPQLQPFPVEIKSLENISVYGEMDRLQRPSGHAATCSPVFSTRKSSSARQSMPEAKNVFSASDGLETIGSPRRLNEVLISTGTPVRRSKASRMR